MFSSFRVCSANYLFARKLTACVTISRADEHTLLVRRRFFEAQTAAHVSYLKQKTPLNLTYFDAAL